MCLVLNLIFILLFNIIKCESLVVLSDNQHYHDEPLVLELIPFEDYHHLRPPPPVHQLPPAHRFPPVHQLPPAHQLPPVHHSSPVHHLPPPAHYTHPNEDYRPPPPPPDQMIEKDEIPLHHIIALIGMNLDRLEKQIHGP